MSSSSTPLPSAPLPTGPATALPQTFARTTPSPTLLAVGAEAHLYRTHFLTPARPCALKVRPPKAWRHPVLDARLARHRVLAEARVLVRCRRAGVSVPGVLALDWEGEATIAARREGGTPGGGAGGEGDAGADAGAGERRTGAWLMLEWVDGLTVRRALDEFGPPDAAQQPTSEEELRSLMVRIGEAVGGLHATGVVHGDLTTSNLMLRPPCAEAVNGTGSGTAAEMRLRPSLEGEIVLIDFGLAAQTVQDEDRAVDLYVLERAFGSTHPLIEERFQEALRAYGASYTGGRIALKRLEDVRMRGRKKSMIG